MWNGVEVITGFHSRNTGMQLTGTGPSPIMFSELCLLGALSIPLFHAFGGRRPKYLDQIATVLFLLTLCAANSYTSLLMSLAFTFSYVVLYHILGASAFGKKGRGKRIINALIQVTVACIAVVVVFNSVQKVETFVVNGLPRAVEYIKNFKPPAQSTEPPAQSAEPPAQSAEPPAQSAEPPAQSAEPPALPDIKIERELRTSATGVRSRIWAAGIRLFLQHPFGITNSNISVKVFYGVPDFEYTNLHNGYLNLLVGAGIVGFALIMVFGLLLLTKAIRTLYVCEDSHLGCVLTLIISICISILAGDLVNGGFVLWRGANYIVLWLLLGEVNASVTKYTIEDK